MKLLEIARVNIKHDSTVYNTMLGCDLLSRLQQKEIKSEVDQKTTKNYKSKKRKKG